MLHINSHKLSNIETEIYGTYIYVVTGTVVSRIYAHRFVNSAPVESKGGIWQLISRICPLFWGHA